MDPFCGGGSTLVEAQRLGCSTVGSDLNPIPVVITKLLTEMLPKVAGLSPLHESTEALPISTRDYDGVALDVLYYASLVGERAWQKVKGEYALPTDAVPIAWLWCRTATCPNPVCRIETPLVTSWVISRKSGKNGGSSPRSNTAASPSLSPARRGRRRHRRRPGGEHSLHASTASTCLPSGTSKRRVDAAALACA